MSNLKRSHLKLHVAFKTRSNAVFLQATTQQYRTVLTYPGDDKYMEGNQERDPANLYTWKIGGEYTNSMNILGLVFFSGKLSSRGLK